MSIWVRNMKATSDLDKTVLMKWLSGLGKELDKF